MGVKKLQLVPPKTTTIFDAADRAAWDPRYATGPIRVDVRDSITIGPHIFKVQWCDDIRTDDGERLLGDSSYELLTIRIRKHLLASVERDTLLHEVMHMIYQMLGLIEDHAPEETTVASVSTLLLQVFTDNRWFADKIANI